MRFVLPTLTFLPGYWFCVADRGFGGLMALLVSPLVLAFALGAGAWLRRRMRIESRLHPVDFVGVAVVLPAAYLLVPTIR